MGNEFYVQLPVAQRNGHYHLEWDSVIYIAHCLIKYLSKIKH